ncbi:hypothetical protein HDU91_002733, partial [Kappamyces sp. JEL0680]
TIHVDVRAQIVKIVCHKCHINSLNLYNQVGIVAINVLGSVLEPSELAGTIDAPLSSAITRGIIERSFADDHTPMDADLNYIDHDRFVVHAMASIAEKKKAAVLDENYTLAKSLKHLQEAFNAIGSDISLLSTEKLGALKVEDYDKAEAIQKKKHLAAQLREAGYELKPEGLVLVSADQPVKRAAQSRSTNPTDESTDDRVRSPVSIDDVPIKSKFAERLASEAEKRPESAGGRESTAPPELTDQEQSRFACAIRVFGKHTVSCVLSSFFHIREEGLQAIDRCLKDGQERDDDELVDATFQMLSIVESDSREKSHLLMCNLYYSLLGMERRLTVEHCQQRQYPDTSLVAYLANTLPALLSKTADMNTRIKTRSTELVFALCKAFHAGDASLLPLVTKPFPSSKTTSVPWKHIKARMDIATELVKLYGLSDGKPPRATGWTSSVCAPAA